MGFIKIRSLCAGFLLCAITLELCSCGMTMPLSAYQQEREKACDQSDVLLTDLSKPVDERQYFLSPGVLCNA